MGLESASFISELVPANPSGVDDFASADNHLRLLKSVLQSQFPNFGAAAVTPTEEELNFVDGVTSAIQDQLDALASSWTLETASFALVARDKKNIEATGGDATATIPDTIAAGDEFTIHNQVTSTDVVDIEPNTGHTIKGALEDVVGDTDTLVLAVGETVRLVAISTSVLEIV